MPSCTDANLRIWNRVPDGSQLRVRVVGHERAQDDQFVASAEVLVTDAAKEEWPDARLRPRGTQKALVSPHGYNVTVRVAFAAADVAQVQASVVKPGGSVYGKSYCHEMNGNGGDIMTCTLIAVTAKSSP